MLSCPRGVLIDGSHERYNCKSFASQRVIFLHSTTTYIWQPLKTFPYNKQWNRKVRVRGALPHTPISKNKFLEMPIYNKNFIFHRQLYQQNRKTVLHKKAEYDTIQDNSKSV